MNEIFKILKVVDKQHSESCMTAIGGCFTELAEDCFKTDLEVGSKKPFLHQRQ